MITRTQKAIDPKEGMTFGELRQFVQDSLRYDIPDSAKVKVVMGMRSQIKSMEVTDASGGVSDEPL